MKAIMELSPTSRSTMLSFERVIRRSGGRCEALVHLPTGVWARCGRPNGQIHHMLKRSRGGALLDKTGEVYHLAVLCYRHHMYVETSGEKTGLLIDGYMSEADGRLVYTGSDEFLKEKYK